MKSLRQPVTADAAVVLLLQPVRRHVTRLGGTCLFLLVIAATSSPQAVVATAAVTGSVEDPSGGAVHGGLRYGVQWLPALVRTDTGSFSRRLGIAYAPGSRRTVVRASAGLFHDRLPLRAVSNALQRDGIN